MIYYDEDTASMEITCDEAGCAENDVLYGTWQECIDEAKQKGWMMYRRDDDGEWLHKCPDHNEFNRDRNIANLFTD